MAVIRPLSDRSSRTGQSYGEAIKQIADALDQKADLDSSGDLRVGGGRLFPILATRENLAATTNTRNTLRLGPGTSTHTFNLWVMPYSGSVLAMSYHLSGAMGTDTLTFGFGVGNGSTFQDVNVATVTGTNPAGVRTFDKDKYQFSANQYIQIFALTGSVYGTATHDVEAILWCEM